ncbi:uncharacterized protein LOC128226273 [Mya arenaria]|uniref:uncharacterized protein LOC128226273 n=1 Tax=Mya arenaria TaxID=6604 RepID=UPI0022DF85DD|nr:uncharacterized protein LOC128226273 [Mya arenaria]
MEGLHGSAPMMNWQSADLDSAWKDFYTHVNFMFNGPLQGKSDEEKSAYLMIWVGQRGREVYSTWTAMADDDKKKHDELKKNFEEYVKPKTNIVFNRYKFQCRVQNDSESCVEYITDLRVLAADCNYETHLDDAIRDRIVFSIKNQKIREKLIQEGSGLKLEKAIDICRSYEISQKQLKTMNAEDQNVHVVKQQKHYKPPNQAAKGKVPQTQKTQNFQKPYKQFNAPPSSCGRCGYRHTQSQTYPAKGKTCKKCGRKYHFAKVCRTRAERKIHELDEDDDYYFDALFVGMLSTSMKQKKERNDTFTENLLVNGVTLKFQLDTGARCNVLTRRDFQALKINGPLRQQAAALRSFSGHRMVPDGMITLNLQCKEETHAVEFYVVDTKSQSILSGETAESIGLIKRIYHIEDEYSTLFQGLGCLPREVKIEIDKSAKPVVHPPRKVPIMLKDKVKAELLKMERLGVIVRQKEPTPWVNSMVTVTKPDKSVRICIDPKDLNNAIQREHYPMKTIEEVVAEMPEAKVFSTIDATSGFWQLNLDTESSKLTKFNTPFIDIDSCVLLWGRDEKEHDERLSAVLKRAEEWNLKLSEKKCQFRKDEEEYVGHKITKERLKPDPEKVRAVQEMKQPTNTKE